MYTRAMYIVRVSYMGAGALGLQPDGGAPRDGRSRDDGISAPHPHTHISTPLPFSHLPCSLSTPPPSPVARQQCWVPPTSLTGRGALIACLPPDRLFTRRC